MGSAWWDKVIMACPDSSEARVALGAVVEYAHLVSWPRVVGGD